MNLAGRRSDRCLLYRPDQPPDGGRLDHAPAVSELGQPDGALDRPHRDGPLTWAKVSDA